MGRDIHLQSAEPSAADAQRKWQDLHLALLSNLGQASFLRVTRLGRWDEVSGDGGKILFSASDHDPDQSLRSNNLQSKQ